MRQKAGLLTYSGAGAFSMVNQWQYAGSFEWKLQQRELCRILTGFLFAFLMTQSYNLFLFLQIKTLESWRFSQLYRCIVLKTK